VANEVFQRDCDSYCSIILIYALSRFKARAWVLKLFGYFCLSC